MGDDSSWVRAPGNPCSAAVLMCTNRLTPAALAASMTFRVPCTLTERHSARGSQSDTNPATCTATSTPRIGASSDARFVMSPRASSTSTPSRNVRSLDARTSPRTFRPSRSKRSTTWLPMNPFAPVTRITPVPE